MKHFFNSKFLLALILGAGVVAAVSIFSGDSYPDDEDAYGEPDGSISEGEVASFVD